MIDTDRALTHYRGLLARLEDEALPKPLPRDRQAAHDLSLATPRPWTYDEIIAHEA